MSVAQINLRRRVTGRSLVYRLNNVGTRTELWGKPFTCHLPRGTGNGSFVAAVPH